VPIYAPVVYPSAQTTVSACQEKPSQFTNLKESTCEPLLPPKPKSRKRHAVASACASYVPTTTGFTVCAVRTIRSRESVSWWTLREMISVGRPRLTARRLILCVVLPYLFPCTPQFDGVIVRWQVPSAGLPGFFNQILKNRAAAHVEITC